MSAQLTLWSSANKEFICIIAVYKILSCTKYSVFLFCICAIKSTRNYGPPASAARSGSEELDIFK